MNKRALAVVEVLERVHKQLNTARLVGRIAVNIGSREVGKAIRHVMNTMNDSKTSSDTVGIHPESRLPLVDYPMLSAVDIIAQLESLSVDELRVLADYENSHRKRRTVLFKIDQLLATNRANHS